MMLLILCFFVSTAFCASTFNVPSTWLCCEAFSEINESGKILMMNSPASVDLQACKVLPEHCGGSVSLRNLAGETLQIFVSSFVAANSGALFSIDVDKQALGAVHVYVQDDAQDDAQGRIDVVGGNNKIISHELGPFYLWRCLQKIQYDFGEDRLTVRKFFGYHGKGEIFVSATIAYSDVKTVVIGCGTGFPCWSAGANGWVFSGEEIVETLRLDSGVKS